MEEIFPAQRCDIGRHVAVDFYCSTKYPGCDYIFNSGAQLKGSIDRSIGSNVCLCPQYGYPLFYSVFRHNAGYFDQFLSLIKLNTYQPLLDAAFSPVTETGALIVQFVCTSLLAAIFEEFAFRGVILQILRRYGNIFAIVCSAFVFGIIHGNTYQIPFAFLFGLVLGAAAVYTGSLWTPVLLHLINNTIAFGLNIVAEKLGEQIGDVVTYITWGVLFLIGAIAAIFTAATAKKSGVWRNDRQPFELDGRKKGYGVFFKAPTILISIVLMAVTAFFMTTLIQDWVNSIFPYANFLG